MRGGGGGTVSRQVADGKLNTVAADFFFFPGGSAAADLFRFFQVEAGYLIRVSPPILPERKKRERKKDKR